MKDESQITHELLGTAESVGKLVNYFLQLGELVDVD